MTIQHPCDHCPWRASNQGKKTPWGFYTKTNLTRLWGQIRRGGHGQSCHPTDPSHEDHIAAGAKPGTKPRECPGAVILVMREFLRIAAFATGPIDGEAIKKYLATRRKGLSKHGILYWLVSRYTMGDTPYIGEGKLPEVDAEDKEIALPKYLEG